MTEEDFVILDRKREPLPNAARRLTITVSRKSVQMFHDEAVKGAVRTVSMPGFRKGKVPPKIIKTALKEELGANTSGSIIEYFTRELLPRENKQPIFPDSVKLEDISQFDLEQDFTFTLSYEVSPTVTLGDYRSLTVKVPRATVKKRDVRLALEKLRVNYAMIIDKPTDAVGIDDLVTIDYWVIDDDGNPIPGSLRQQVSFILSGENTIEFPFAAIAGMKIDEERHIEHRYTDDHFITNVRGRRTLFGVVVKNIRERRLPDLDNELAQDISDSFKTLSDLRKSVRQTLKEQSKRAIRDFKYTEILQQMIESSQFDIPNSMIGFELTTMLQRYAELSWRSPIYSEEERGIYSSYFLPAVIHNIKQMLVEECILKNENIVVEDEEVQERIAQDIHSTSNQDDTSFEDIRNVIKFEKLTQRLLSFTKFRHTLFKSLDMSK